MNYPVCITLSGVLFGTCVYVYLNNKRNEQWNKEFIAFDQQWQQTKIDINKIESQEKIAYQDVTFSNGLKVHNEIVMKPGNNNSFFKA